jgi:SEC-C motif-containing protein
VGEREAPTPEALVRARFAAFARADAAYLWRTLHSEHEDRAESNEAALVALRNAAQSHRYMRLTILDARENEVLFVAGVYEKGQDRSFVELSEFGREDGAWRYLSGIARPAAELGDLQRLRIEGFPRG